MISVRTSRTVRVQPSGVDIEVQAGESILAAAQRLGHHWPTMCGGTAHCNRCWFRVADTTRGLESRSAIEIEGLQRVRWRIEPRDDERLACQATVSLNVDLSDLEFSAAEAHAVEETYLEVECVGFRPAQPDYSPQC